MEPEDLDLLARGAGRALVMSRLLIGRCLVEMDRRSLALDWGYSGTIHYAVRALRISRKAAREARRVARELIPLPRLSAAAEEGEISWSHLREVVRVAVPQTEEAWIDAARRYRWRTFHRLVRQAGPGDLPGEASPEACVAEETELRLRLTEDQMELVTAGLARLSRRLGRMVGPAEALEYAFAELLADDDAILEHRLQQARILLGEFRDLRDRQERQEDARARSAAVRAWRQEQLREAEGGEAARPTWVTGEPTEPACTRHADDQPARETGPTWVTEEGAEGEQPTREARPTWVTEEAGEAACTRQTDDQPAQGTGPTWITEEAGKAARPTWVTGEVSEAGGPTWVTDDPPGRVREFPQPSPPLPFAYPAPASGDAVLRDAEAKEVGPEPPIRWEMVSSTVAPLPGRPDLLLVTVDRRPFWEEASEPAPGTGARPGTDRAARRSRAIQRGAHTRRGSAETQRTVQRRDGFACQCPDCPHTVWLHSHHLTLYCRGGLSVPSNQVLLCSGCHRNVHRGRLRVSGNPESGLEWRDRRGLALGEAAPQAGVRARALARRVLSAGMG